MTKGSARVRTGFKRHLLNLLLVYVTLSGCASVDHDIDASLVESVPQRSAERTSADIADIAPSTVKTRPKAALHSPRTEAAAQSRQSVMPPVPLSIDHAQRTGTVESQGLSEISGLAASHKTPGVLFAVNDSGNTGQLFALSETGADLGHWTIKAHNRDWEDMGNLRLAGKDYLVIGDTGDNQQIHKQSRLYLIEEPSLDTPANTIINPAATISFVYEDGPRNVEAFAFNGTTLYLVSKERVGPDGPQPSRLYELQIPEQIDSSVLIARHTGNLPLSPTNLESRLAAAFAGVDLNHPTALEFDTDGNTAYLLTYRHVMRIVKAGNQSWADAFSESSERLYAHDLKQAEALTVVPGKSLWITSEYPAAPLWALPLLAPS